MAPDGPSEVERQLVQARDLADYERSCAVIAQLTDVRFKLAAFVPALTGAGVGLITTGSATPFDRAFLSVGGLMFVIGIVIYDLRNTQHYATAMGRAKALEEELGLRQVETDRHSGVFGTRADSKDALAAQRRDRFRLLPLTWWWSTIPVRHATGLALAYGAAVMAWTWSFADAVIDGMEWVVVGRWFAVAGAALVGALFVVEYTRVDTSLTERLRARSKRADRKASWKRGWKTEREEPPGRSERDEAEELA